MSNILSKLEKNEIIYFNFTLFNQFGEIFSKFDTKAFLVLNSSTPKPLKFKFSYKELSVLSGFLLYYRYDKSYWNNFKKYFEFSNDSITEFFLSKIVRSNIRNSKAILEWSMGDKNWIQNIQIDYEDLISNHTNISLVYSCHINSPN
ncbi:unnamed protein product [Brachionus calyciflorus]|uniref:Uncharacterized protein n=1 Tax=Brachionus calyciflorus TaxID=104777 RepID=A0A814G4B6_9BILA|nr:unnamed protein product [Brachionus calyciflorus]